jgi:hypothetical protein
MQDLESNLENAIKYRVEEGAFEVSIFTGQGDYTKANPSLIVHAESGNEFPIGSGNFNVTVQCELRMSAELDEKSTFDQLKRDVFGQLMVDALPTQLSQEATNLHVFGITGREFRNAVDENQWLSVLSFTAYCCRTDLS